MWTAAIEPAAFPWATSRVTPGVPVAALGSPERDSAWLAPIEVGELGEDFSSADLSSEDLCRATTPEAILNAITKGMAPRASLRVNLAPDFALR